MPEINSYNQPLSDREEIAKRAAMGPSRKHGKVAPKPMVKDRQPKVDTSESASRFRKFAAGTLGVVAAGSLLLAANDARQSEQSQIEEQRTTVEVESGDTLTDLVRQEAKASGHNPEDVAKYVDAAVEWNNGSSVIHPGREVSIPDIPNQPGSPQAIASENAGPTGAEQYTNAVSGANVVTNDQSSQATQPNQIP